MADAQMDFIDAAKHLTRTTRFRSKFCQRVDPAELLPHLNLAQQHAEEVANITHQQSKYAGCQKLWEYLHREPGWPQDLADALRGDSRHSNLLQILETALPHHCRQSVQAGAAAPVNNQGHRVPPRRRRNRGARGGGPPPPGGVGGAWAPPDRRAGGGWAAPDGRAGGGWAPPDGRAGGGWGPPDGRAGGGWGPPPGGGWGPLPGDQARAAGPGNGLGWGPLPDQGTPCSQPARGLPTPTGAQPQQPLPDPRLPVEEERGPFRGVEEEESDPSGEKVLTGGQVSQPQQSDPSFPPQESKLGDDDDDDDENDDDGDDDDGDDDDNGDDDDDDDDGGGNKKGKENKEGGKDGRDEDKDEDEAEGGDAIRKGELMKQLAAAHNTELPAAFGQIPPSTSATSSLSDTVAHHSVGNDTVVLHDDEEEEEEKEKEEEEEKERGEGEEEEEEEEVAINVTRPGDDENNADRAPSRDSTIDLQQHRHREADLESNASLTSNAPSESTIDLNEVRQRNQPPEPPSTIELHQALPANWPRGPAPAPDSIPSSTYSEPSIAVRDAPRCFHPSSSSESGLGVGPMSSSHGVAADPMSSPAQSDGSSLGSLGPSSGAGSLPQSIRLHPDRASNHTGVSPRPGEDASSSGPTPSLLSRMASTFASVTNIFFESDG